VVNLNSTPRPDDNPSVENVTELLDAWGRGDAAALNKLMPLVYEELHRLAHQYMGREGPGHTMQTTELLNEAYLRLVDQKQAAWQNRAQFIGIAAQLMRRVLIDHARSRASEKRGGTVRPVTLDEAAVLSPTQAEQVLAVDEALQRLSNVDPRKGRIVELRYFGGLTVGETAEVLKISPVTVMRDWSFAKAWLHRELSCDR
jgi:RNA polymerase sigma factor (TIGR02999 family)